MTSPIPKLPVVLPPSADGSSFAFYRQASATHGTIDLPDGTSPQDFFIDAVNYQLPHAVLTRARSCPHIITRGPAEIARDDAPTIQLYLFVAGSSDTTDNGTTTRTGPGELIILDSQRDYRSVATAFDVRIVMVARDRAPLGLLSPGVHGLRLPATSAGTRVLAATMESLLREVEGLSMAEADHAVAALCQLAAGLAATQLARRDTGRGRFADPQLDAAMAYIEREFLSAELTPDRVRRHVGISRSGLYRLFEPFNGIDGVIRARRLDTAMRALLTAADPAPAVEDLAAGHGFRNEVHFIRAFQARFGTTPAKFRVKIATGDKPWLRDQAIRAGFATLEAWLAALSGPVLGDAGQVDVRLP